MVITTHPRAPGMDRTLLCVSNPLPKPDLGVLLTPCCTLLLPEAAFAVFLGFR